ncbi:hypothetical protein MD484_g5089, partial [Candolleomyces efflorescens]
MPPTEPQSSPLSQQSSPSPTPLSNTSVLGKRKAASHTYVDADDGDLSDSAEGRNLARRKPSAGPRKGSSWALQKELKSRSKEPEFEAHSLRLRTFRSKILGIDAFAEFTEDDLCAVRCSSCSRWIQMRILYDILRFSEHRSTSMCQRHQDKGMVTKSLFALGFTRQKKSEVSLPAPCMVSVPCPGLTRESSPLVGQYLSRSAASTGGAPSRISIARTLLPEVNAKSLRWVDLTGSQQTMVIRQEAMLAAWRVARNIEAVYSTKCLGTVYGAVGEEPRPCERCESLYELHTFQNAIRRPIPSEENMRFVPKAYRLPQLGDIYLRFCGVRDLMETENGKSPWLKFAKGVVSGEYDSQIVLGMVEAFVAKNDRAQAGKSLRNLQYTPAFSDFCDILSALSPVAYATFREHFGGRTPDSIRKLRMKRPRFQPGFSASNVATIATTLAQYNYCGPVTLSWDDTDLEPAISIFQESKDISIIVGGSAGVVRVGPADDLDRLFERAQFNPATKLRIWLLNIPLPKIPPFMIAAVARGSSDTANDLKAMHDQVVSLLHSHHIFPISGACDGTETERSLQGIIARAAPSTQSYSIPNSYFGSSAAIALTIPLIESHHPFISIQDSKHALKTARNQILTGARLLTIGNETLYYEQLREAAANSSGPLFVRDVERLDRQDDRAAARAFSAAMLDFHLRTYPHQRALSVYLFVLGELVDAWQNRRIGHLARAKMVMRARFFLMAWRSHIVAHPEHSVNIHFISRESFDIFITLCDSLLSLFIVYRKYHPGFPLLPWLHSTESCEHAFGVLRKVKPDFTYADMLAIEPKMAVLMSGAFKDLTESEKANRTAAGYYHTYYKAHGLDLKVLVCMPTDLELAAASNTAAQEASQLLSSLGVSAAKMIAKYQPPSSATQPTPIVLPPNQTTLASLLRFHDNTWRESCTRAVQEEIQACEFAIAAEKATRSQAIHDLPEMDEAQVNGIEAFLGAVSNEIAASFTVNTNTVTVIDSLVPLHLVQGAKTLEVQILVTERLRHQTDETSKAVRKTANQSIALDMNSRTLQRFIERGPTLREELATRLKALSEAPAAQSARSKASISATSGVNRQVRTSGAFAGHSITTTQDQNKATVRNSAAIAFLEERDRSFVRFRGPRLHENFHIANISQFVPLAPGNLVIALSPVATCREVILGEVITMYSKGPGKNSKHEWIKSMDKLGVASYIYVRKLSAMAGDSVFTSLTCPTLSSPTYLQIPRTHLLFSLASFSQSISIQSISVNGNDFNLVNLCSISAGLFNVFNSNCDELYEALKVLLRSLNGQRRQGSSGEKDEDEDEAD